MCFSVLSVLRKFGLRYLYNSNNQLAAGSQRATFAYIIYTYKEHPTDHTLIGSTPWNFFQGLVGSKPKTKFPSSVTLPWPAGKCRGPGVRGASGDTHAPRPLFALRASCFLLLALRLSYLYSTFKYTIYNIRTTLANYTFILRIHIIYSHVLIYYIEALCICATINASSSAAFLPYT